MKRKTKRNRIAIIIISIALMIALSPITVHASVYDDAYNIHDANAYADKWKKDINYKDYRDAEPDCTNFVSQCLIAGGIKESDGWNKNHTRYLTGYTDAYNTFVNVTLLKSYLAKTGYTVGETVFCNPNEIKELDISAGDILQLDFEGDGVWDHSLFCVGLDKTGQVMVACHSPYYYGTVWQEDGMLVFEKRERQIKPSKCFCVIHMTNTSGLTDVTRRYIDKTIAIKSLEVNQYVSSNTDKDIAGINATVNKSSASTWEYFDVISGDYGEIGFRAHGNRNYLSARIDENDKNAYIQAAYGQNYIKPQSWESFRIFEKDGVQYIQSQANGKWVQASKNETDNPLRAAGASASTWERFHIEVVGTLNGTSSKESNESVSPSMSNTVSLHYHASDYNEGWYEGEWRNGNPNGYGKLTYDDFDDGKYYMSYGYKAVSYEGNFVDGFRSGWGKVTYENGWWEEGQFYGMWQAGKVVFDGRLYSKPDCYRTVKTTATSTIAASTEFGEWTTP